MPYTPLDSGKNLMAEALQKLQSVPVGNTRFQMPAPPPQVASQAPVQSGLQQTSPQLQQNPTIPSTKSIVQQQAAGPVGNATPGSLAAKVLQTASGHLGVNEADGSASKWLHMDTQTIAWCQAAVNQIFKEAGKPLPNQGNLGTRNSYSTLVQQGYGSSVPVVGGLAYKKRPGNNKGHVGIVVAYDPKSGSITTLEGNSGDKLTKRVSNISRWDLGFVDPYKADTARG